MKISYLLGAGASALAIPDVKSIKRNRTIEKFAGDLDLLSNSTIPVWGRIALEIKRYYSFDTLAKKLSLIDPAGYKKLKAFIELYLTYEQMVRTISLDSKDGKRELDRIDQRYYPWVLNLMRHDFSFPDNVNLITWNYDLQLPLVYADVTNTRFQELMPYELENHELTSSCCPVPIYLNGLIASQSSEVDDIMSNLYKPDELLDGKLMGIGILKDYFRKKIEEVTAPDYTSPLLYAWDLKATGITKAMSRLSDSQQLVVIGYSFPLFNREYDRKLLEAFMRDRQKIHYDYGVTIYVQDLNPEPIVESIKAILSSILSGDDWDSRDLKAIKVLPIQHCDEFYVPHSFTPVY